ncbi:cytochrome b [Caballeronia ptereochthonis]|uniref:Cytochrome B561 n=1 Tax=Caballeronia ptereochthonis TaxID=1777144 RepID=A0A157ZYC1_9BURK|nr:cytochrome b [Caballeronia ptereochthonis]SAK50541.1 cytochrome B561 [Caballeronia ptereochthonis]
MPENRSSTVKYRPVAKLLHWLMVPLVLAQFIIGWTMPDVHHDTVPTGLISWHLSVGAAIIALMLVRAVLRLIDEPEAIEASFLRDRLSGANHLLLYVMLIVVPVTGWANASARGWIVRLLGVFYYPLITRKGSSVGQVMGNVHGWLAWALLVLIIVHVAIAAFHHFVLRDDVLQRML